MPRITDDDAIELTGEYDADPSVPCPECDDDAWRSVENDLVMYDHSDGRTCVLTAIEDARQREEA